VQQAERMLRTLIASAAASTDVEALRDAIAEAQAIKVGGQLVRDAQLKLGQAVEERIRPLGDTCVKVMCMQHDEASPSFPPDYTVWSDSRSDERAASLRRATAAAARASDRALGKSSEHPASTMGTILGALRHVGGFMDRLKATTHRAHESDRPKEDGVSRPETQRSHGWAMIGRVGQAGLLQPSFETATLDWSKGFSAWADARAVDRMAAQRAAEAAAGRASEREAEEIELEAEEERPRGQVDWEKVNKPESLPRYQSRSRATTPKPADLEA